MKKRYLSLALAILSVLMVVTGTALQMQQQRIAKNMIRLHVVANSDSEEDQSAKLEVRDAVLTVTDELLSGADDPKTALAGGLTQIADAAEAKLLELGCAAPVHVSLGKEVFPTREYDTFSLPAGVYESLRVTIGAGEGHNWWCVVFPSLCLSASMDDLEQAVEAVGMTQGDFQLITSDAKGVVLKFKSFELLQKLKTAIFG